MVNDIRICQRVLEVIVTNEQEARAAEEGGATRLELIRAFEVGGLTPDISVVRQVVDAVKIPVRVMLREQATFTLENKDDQPSNQTLEAVIDKALMLSKLKIDGIVLGYLCNGAVDQITLEKILSRVPGIRVTFHRAFEATKDPRMALLELQRFSPQIDRVLTNGGGKRSWSDRIALLVDWQRLAQPIKILVGGDVDEEVLKRLAKTTLPEVHVGRAARQPQTVEGAIDIAKLRQLRGIWDKLS